MFSSKFFQNFNSSGSSTSINLNSSESYTAFPNFEFTSAELYPRRRHTEFYFQAAIPEEFQSRDFEHPSSLDSEEIQKWKREKIVPPKSSSTRIARNSYFS